MYKVISAYVTARVTNPLDGQDNVIGFYRGAVLPEGTPQSEIDHLLDVGMIEDVDKAALVSPLSTDDEVKAALADDPDGPGGVPAKSASKADWVAYAVSQGKPEDEANAATKDELVAEYVK